MLGPASWNVLYPVRKARDINLKGDGDLCKWGLTPPTRWSSHRIPTIARVNASFYYPALSLIAGLQCTGHPLL